MKKIIWVLWFTVTAVQAEEIFTNEFETLVATRVNSLVLKDPHLFYDFFGCNDITAILNTSINDQIGLDDDGDGFLDLNLLVQFKTDQPSYISTKQLTLDILNASCADPLFSAPCIINQTLAADVSSDFTELGSCLSPVAGTASNYVDAVTDTIGPCYATEPVDVTLNLNGIGLPLDEYQQASRYQGGLIMDEGLHMGFVSEADAMNVIIPADVPLVGGSTLFDLLPGGGNACGIGDEKDTGPDGVTEGWWFYFNSESDLIELN